MSAVEAHAYMEFGDDVDSVLAKINQFITADKYLRIYSIKVFEKDEKIIDKLHIANILDINKMISVCENNYGDTSDSIITVKRYKHIYNIMKDCIKTAPKQNSTVSDKIDKVVTNKWLALPIFAVIMFIMYFVSVSTVGTMVTDWANDGVFGEGFHLLGIGSKEYEEAINRSEQNRQKVELFLEAADQASLDTIEIAYAIENSGLDISIIDNFVSKAEDAGVSAFMLLDDNIELIYPADFRLALDTINYKVDPADYGVWIVGVPVAMDNILTAINYADWLKGLIIDGIIAGVGAALGFVPQLFILFIFLAFLEYCGYMARIAFIMDRAFRRFGLSGKSFISILIGTGCSVPAVMATRTIENEGDRKMTVITTSFMPCSAKLPVIALISGALFGGAWWFAFSAYFIGMAAVICSGIVLKKTSIFEGEFTPFIIELPKYRWPSPVNVLISMWQRSWAFIKQAGSIILLSTMFIWFTSNFALSGYSFISVDMPDSMLASIGSSIAWIFAPLGFGDWKAAVATISGLVAKENVVSTFGILYNFFEVAEDGAEIWSELANSFSMLSAYSLLVFNLLCAPCFAAIGAISREMGNTRWSMIAIGYQCIFAYAVSLCIYQLGMLFTGGGFGFWSFVSLVLVAVFLFMLFKPARNKLLMVVKA